MAKYTKQDRKDMSIGTRDYDKGYAKGMKMGSMGHDGTVRSIETSDAEQFDLNKVQWRPMQRRGYSMEAFDYKY